MARKDLLNRLADAGEEAIGRLAQSPGAERVVDAMGSMRDRMDELQKRVRGIDALEKRVVELERRLDEQAKPKRSSTGASSRSPASATRSSKTRSSTASGTKKPKTSGDGSSTGRAGGESPG